MSALIWRETTVDKNHLYSAVSEGNIKEKRGKWVFVFSCVASINLWLNHWVNTAVLIYLVDLCNKRDLFRRWKLSRLFLRNAKTRRKSLQVSENLKLCVNSKKLNKTSDTKLRASLYEPGNHTGSVTGSLYMANFSPVDRDEIQETQSCKMVKRKLDLFAAVRALWTLVALLIKLIRILLKWKCIQHRK